MTRLHRAALAGLLLALATPGTAAPPTPPAPVIVELFTSQSCSSCPLAEQLAERLMREQPIAGAQLIVIAEHVDYWDHLQWKDPYSSPEWTRRQRAYAQLLATRAQVYTPQAVVAGSAAVIGSDEGALLAALRTAAAQPRGHLDLRLERQGDAAVVMIGHSSAALPEGYQYWAALLQDGIATAVGSGENGGVTLRENGVLRSLQPLKTRATRIALPTDAADEPLRIVVFAQNTRDGRIASAGQAPLPPR